MIENLLVCYFLTLSLVLNSMFLYLQAELNNISCLTFPADYEFTFELECSKCHEPAPKRATFNTIEQHEIEGSKGEASYVATCKFCQARGNINISFPKKFAGYQESGAKVPMLQIDARGWEITKFVPEQPLKADSFSEVLFDDGEWYDYNDDKGEEVSVVETVWTIGN